MTLILPPAVHQEWKHCTQDFSVFLYLTDQELQVVFANIGGLVTNSLLCFLQSAAQAISAALELLQ